MTRSVANLHAASESLILGPPKTAFASAGRKSGGASESHNRASLSNEDEETSKDRNPLREVGLKASTRHERNGEYGREPRAGSLQKLRGEKGEMESWSASRQTGPYKKPNDFDGEHERKESIGQGDRFRDLRRGENGASSDRPSWPPRRSEPAWARGEEKKENAPDRGSNKSQDWRDDKKVVRSWDRGERQDRDPEWMEEPEPEENRKARTQDDFERWKAKMKAGGDKQANGASETRQQEEDVETFGEEVMVKDQKTVRPLLLDAGFDDFLNLGGKSKVTPAFDAEVDVGVQQPTTTGPKWSKASKFSSLFNPNPIVVAEPIREHPPPPPPPPPPAPASPPKDSSAEDKAGFARILSLLGQHQPSYQSGPNVTRPPAQNQPTSPIQLPFAGEDHKVADFFEQRSPPPAPKPSRDSEFLLNLMQQRRERAEGPQAHTNNRVHEPTNHLPLENLVITPKDQKRPNPGSFLGFPSLDQVRDDMAPPNLQPEQQRRPPPGFPDMSWNGNLQRSPIPPGFPPNIPRPPGLDPFGPGFPQQRGPPPGFSGPARINAGPPGLMPQLPPDRGPPFGIRPGGPGMPPQGFMNVNGPPPGLPNMMFHQGNGPFGNGGGYREGSGMEGPQSQQQQQQRR